MSARHVENPIDTNQRHASKLKDTNYWKRNYVIEAYADEIERNIKSTIFRSSVRYFELIYVEKGKNDLNILISQGSDGHAYVFADECNY